MTKRKVVSRFCSSTAAIRFETSRLVHFVKNCNSLDPLIKEEADPKMSTTKWAYDNLPLFAPDFSVRFC